MSKLYTASNIILAQKTPETEQKVGSLILTSNKNTPLLTPIILPDDIKIDIRLTDKLLVNGSMTIVVEGVEYQLVKVDQILLVIRD